MLGCCVHLGTVPENPRNFRPGVRIGNAQSSGPANYCGSLRRRSAFDGNEHARATALLRCRALPDSLAFPSRFMPGCPRSKRTAAGRTWLGEGRFLLVGRRAVERLESVATVKKACAFDESCSGLGRRDRGICVADIDPGLQIWRRSRVYRSRSGSSIIDTYHSPRPFSTCLASLSARVRASSALSGSTDPTSSLAYLRSFAAFRIVNLAPS